MAVHTELWFWLIVISIILIIVGIIAYFIYNRGVNTPRWVWAVIGIGLLFLILGIIVAVIRKAMMHPRCVHEMTEGLIPYNPSYQEEAIYPNVRRNQQPLRSLAPKLCSC